MAIRVTYFQRRPQTAYFSVERLFEGVRMALTGAVQARVAVSRYPSRGPWRLLYNMIEAVFRQGDVNHITGDVHYLALLLQKRRTVLTILDLVTVHRLGGLRKRLFLYFWYWLPIKRSAMITVISAATRMDLLRHVRVAPDKIRIIHCCISPAFHPDLRPFNAANPVILQIGTGPNKNLERVAEALVGLPCRLRIVGRISPQQEAHLNLLGLAFTSVADVTDEQMIEEYRQCDLLVFASTYEGFGLPIAEAQATGRPVVTSDLLSMPEVAGKAACLVDPFVVAGIRAGIMKVVHDSGYRENLVATGLVNVERFKAETIAQQYTALYEEISAS